MKITLRALAIGILAMAVTSGFAFAGEALDRIKKDGVVRIGLNNQYPFAFKEPDGSLSGFAYETTKAVFAAIGVQKIEPVVMDWASMIPGLKANRIDVIVAGMFIRPARCEQVAFSNPDYQAFDTLIVLKGNPRNLHSFNDVIKNENIKVAAIQGGATALTLKNIGVPERQHQILPGYVEMFAALKAGRVDGVTIDTVSSGKFLAADAQNIERAEPFQVPVIDGAPATSYGGYVFRLEDKDLVELFNKYLDRFVGSPEQLALLRKYGLGPNDIPPRTATVARLCAK